MTKSCRIGLRSIHAICETAHGELFKDAREPIVLVPRAVKIIVQNVFEIAT